MANLFSPLTIKDVTLRNRSGVSPMCQYSAVDGVPTDWHLVHLGSRAVGGAGLVIAEATGVSAVGRITPGCTGLWNEAQIGGWERVTRFVKEHGAVAGVQIAHAGRKASTHKPWEGNHSLSEAEGAWQTLGPSDVSFGGHITHTPKAMTQADIEQTVADFRQAAENALEAGFEWLEVHAAHGYLLHSFYSPLTNEREDAYGGSFENRVRMLLEVVTAVRGVWPERLPLTVRVNSTDWHPDGWTIEDTVALAHKLKAAGVDLIDCSSSVPISGSGVRVDRFPGWQVPFAERVKQEVGVLTAAVGGITEPALANEIIEKGQADVVLLAREMLKDAYWGFHAAEELGIKAQDYMPVQNVFWMG